MNNLGYYTETLQQPGLLEVLQKPDNWLLKNLFIIGPDRELKKSSINFYLIVKLKVNPTILLIVDPASMYYYRQRRKLRVRSWWCPMAYAQLPPTFAWMLSILYLTSVNY